MLAFIPSIKADAPLRVLCLGAHCDDIEIGCGGALLRLREQVPRASFRWVVASGSKQRQDECRRAAKMLLGSDARFELTLWEFRDGYMPFSGAQVKDAFERLKAETAPDLIFTHFRDDLHQDHRLINSLTWNTFRNHMVLEYEVPKYDGDFRSPSFYVPLSDEQCRRKLDCLMECYPSQQAHRWFTPETFRAVMRVRGVECAADSGYAEGFYARKVVW